MDRVGTYLLLGRLAGGGLCEVYLARGGRPSRDVVIKRLHPELVTEAVKKEFLQLAQAAQQLQHPNLLQVVESGEEDGVPYLVYLNMPGNTLEVVLQRARKQGLVMPHGLICSLLTQVCRGLHYLHVQGGEAGAARLHRGVRPSNLHLDYDGTLRLMDAGMQRVRQLAALDQPEVLAGRYEYAAPEQCGDTTEDIRSDVFSAGVLLYELITRRRLFRRQSELATRRALLHDPIAAPSKVASNIPFELEQVALRALARQPAERYADAQQMEKELIAAARAHGWESSAAAAIGVLTPLFPAAERRGYGFDEEQAKVDVGSTPYGQEVPSRVAGAPAQGVASPKSADKTTAKMPALADTPEQEAQGLADEDCDEDDQTVVEPPAFLSRQAEAAGPAGRPEGGGLEVEDASIPTASARALPLPPPRPLVREKIEETSLPAAGLWSASSPSPGGEGIEDASFPGPAPLPGSPELRALSRRWLWSGLGGGAVFLALALALFFARDESAANDSVTVVSEPPGAQVLIDGKPRPGKTPLTLHGLDPQRAYSVVLLAQGFAPFKTRLEPARGQETRLIEARLSARGGGAAATLAVRANVEGAQIYLDGELLGTAPLELTEISCCQPHELLARKEGYLEQTLQLGALQAGERKELEITLAAAALDAQVPTSGQGSLPPASAD